MPGTLKIAAPSSFGELYILPLVRQFKQHHPDLTLDMHLSDHYVDLVDDGFDVAIRIGLMEDSNLISRRLAKSDLGVLASPEFLEKNGEPKTPDELKEFECIRDSNSRSGYVIPFEVKGEMHKVPISGKFLANSATAAIDLARLGEGIVLSLDFVVWPDVASDN